jgi:hypothetical protein
MWHAVRQMAEAQMRCLIDHQPLPMRLWHSRFRRDRRANPASDPALRGIIFCIAGRRFM